MPNQVALDQTSPAVRRSLSLWQRANTVIPGATQTLAKGAGQQVRGVAPLFASRGRGSRVWDVDGNEYIDMTMGVGPLVLGYANEAVDDAIRRQLADGITFSLPHELEVEVAEEVRRLVPNAERIRFSKTGADAASAAVRVARAFTGRDRVLCCGYHGWHDWYIGVSDRPRGVPEAVRELTNTFDYNDPASLDDALDVDVACVILEPMVFEMPSPGFLEYVREACHRVGALLIFDEMWTGFRLALGGAQQELGVDADLVTYSKAIANGMPLSVVAGREDVMSLFERDVFFYTTFGGEALSLAAARATLRELELHDVPAHLARVGGAIRDGYNAIAAQLGMQDYTRCIGHPARTLVTFDAEAGPPLFLKSLLQQELVRHGVLWGGANVVSFAHRDEDVSHLLAAYREGLTVVRDAVEGGDLRQAIRGEPIEPSIRRTSQFNLRPRVRT